MQNSCFIVYRMRNSVNVSLISRDLSMSYCCRKFYIYLITAEHFRESGSSTTTIQFR